MFSSRCLSIGNVVFRNESSTGFAFASSIERDELALELVEDLGDLGRLHPLLVVVQQGVVGLAVEALDVPALELDVVLEVGQERLEVGVLARFDPDRQRRRGRVRDLSPQLARHFARLLPVAPRDADEAGLVRLGIEAFLVRPELVEQPSDLVRGEALVRQPVERRGLLGAQAGSARRHEHLLIPVEQVGRTGEVDNLAQTLLQLIELLVHGSPFRPRARRSASHPAIRRPSQMGVRTT